MARSPVFDGFYQKLDAIILQIIPGYSWVKGMTGSLSDADAEKMFKPVAVIQDDMVQIGYEVERPAGQLGRCFFYLAHRILAQEASAISRMTESGRWTRNFSGHRRLP